MNSKQRRTLRRAFPHIVESPWFNWHETTEEYYKKNKRLDAWLKENIGKKNYTSAIIWDDNLHLQVSFKHERDKVFFVLTWA